MNNKNSDVAKMQEYGFALVNAVDATIRPWLEHHTSGLLGGHANPQVTEAIEHASTEARRLLTELAEADIDQPLSGPLERIRRAVALLTPVLHDAGAPHPHRDAFDVEMRPDDVYALGPMAFSDLGEAVHNAGITWGAAKAYLHQQRRSPSGPPGTPPSA